MYKELNKVFSMIQTELKSEKVELALVDDAKEAIKKLSDIEEVRREVVNLAAKGSNKMKQLDKELSDVRSDLVIAINREKAVELFKKYIKNAQNIKNKLEKSAKELGVSPNSIQGYKDLDNDIGVAEFDVKRLQQAIDLAKNTLKTYR
mgnify:FL=1|tara:strand:+ start:400 stop:843 length:444 start_codon:yes stop_codon:yes gene_type:complete